MRERTVVWSVVEILRIAMRASEEEGVNARRLLEASLQELKRMHSGEVAQPRQGICGNLDNVHATRFDCLHGAEMVATCAKSWNEYSGDVAYPVPNTTGMYISASDMYCDTVQFRIARQLGLWGVSSYADSRRRLVLHMINILELALYPQAAI